MRDKSILLKDIMIALSNNNIDEADRLISIFMDEIPEISAKEVTDLAQKLEDEGVFKDHSQHAIIEKKIFRLIDKKIPKEGLEQFKAGHPIHTFLEENSYMKKIISRAMDLINKKNSFDDLYTDWILISKEIAKIHIHYLRKENQLFPFLEKRGFSHPSTIMWSIHDEIRAIIKKLRQSVDNKNEKESIDLLKKSCVEIEEMFVKEERILLPRASKLLTNEDWLAIRAGEDEISWIIKEPPKSWEEKIDLFLKSNDKRVKIIIDITKSFLSGENIEKLKERFKNELQGKISAKEFAVAEQKAKNYGISDSTFEKNVDELLAIFKSGLERPDKFNLEEGHPVDTFVKENVEIKKLLEKIKKLDLKDKNRLEKLYKELLKVDIHYLRKENQLFPFLEKKGFDKPSTVMWSLHDKIRKLIKTNINKYYEENFDKFISMHNDMLQETEGMIFKEEKILFPTSLELISLDEWVEIRNGEEEIGYCFIEKPVMWNPNWKHPSETDIPNSEESYKIDPIPFKGAKKSSNIGGINLEVGSISPEQINLIFKHMPFDITYVDEFDEVRFYNKGEERVFPRSPGIIGRQVKFCHPPKSVHIVEKIVDAFKKGEKNEASFWINFAGKFVYIQYFAVRDDAGHYKGVLEITYDGTDLRKLEGEQRLLDWE